MKPRKVVVVMPFGGRERVQRRQAILNFKRLEYLVLNKCQVKAGPDMKDNVLYSVEVCKTALDEIPERVLQQIYNADILIALIADSNPNVIYEVAYRRILERKFILVVSSPDDLPLYLRSWAYCDWTQKDVLKRIDDIANDNLPPLSDFDASIPDILKAEIDLNDDGLKSNLEQALQAFELQIKPTLSMAAQHLRGIVSEETSSFYPCSIVEVSFSGYGKFEDPQCPAVVCDFDDEFARLYGYVGAKAAEDDRPLTLEKLSNRIKGFIDDAAWAKFLEEQLNLTATVIQDYGFARATVPLQINARHPRREYRGASYLPCLVAQVVDGDRNGPHKMYLLIVYVEIPKTIIADGPST